MTPEELEKLAEVVSTLTDVAQEALQAELSRRGIKVESSGEPVLPEPKETEIVPLRVFRDLPRALLAKSVLDSADIPCFLSDENTIRMDWFCRTRLAVSSSSQRRRWLGGYRSWLDQKIRKITQPEDESMSLRYQLPQ